MYPLFSLLYFVHLLFLFTGLLKCVHRFIQLRFFYCLARPWYAVFPLICVSVLSMKTRNSECLADKTLGSLRYLFLATYLFTPTIM